VGVLGHLANVLGGPDVPTVTDGPWRDKGWRRIFGRLHEKSVTRGGWLDQDGALGCGLPTATRRRLASLGPVSDHPATPAPTAAWPARLAAGLLGAQALALLGFALYYVVELVRGGGDDVTRVLMSAVVILLFAAALVAVARALWQGSSWARSATVVWQLLLLPVGISLLQSGQAGIGAAVLVVAILTLAGLAMDRRATV